MVSDRNDGQRRRIKEDYLTISGKVFSATMNGKATEGKNNDACD
jgi:hypothetical protein